MRQTKVKSGLPELSLAQFWEIEWVGTEQEPRRRIITQTDWNKDLSVPPPPTELKSLWTAAANSVYSQMSLICMEMYASMFIRAPEVESKIAKLKPHPFFLLS